MARRKTTPPPKPAPETELTYSSYLQLDELLKLQRRRSDPPEHDEMLFIIIHQVYELWFKEVLHELGLLQKLFERGDGAAALLTLRRILTILKTLVAQIDVLETMSPVSFASFRKFLQSASGLQSLQFRQLEYVLGLRDARVLSHHRNNPAAVKLLEGIARKPSVYDSFLRLLAAQGHPIPREILERDFTKPAPESAAVRAILLDIYRKSSPLSVVCERMLDLDEGLQEWRYRHVKMVERTIGARSGTGGSPGAAYLLSTLFRSLFPDLLAIRVDL